MSSLAHSPEGGLIPTEDSLEAVVARVKAESRRRQREGEGCNACVYCRDLGAPELCRHYDLSLAVMEAEEREAARTARETDSVGTQERSDGVNP